MSYGDVELYPYDLTKDSVVWDCGGYFGGFAAAIDEKYGCKIRIFEPLLGHYARLQKRFKDRPNVTVEMNAVGGKARTERMHAMGDKSGLFSAGATFWAIIRDIGEMASAPVDLLALNIEGMEFEVVDRILEKEIAPQFKNILVQFHPVIPDSQARYDKIKEGLSKTHRQTFCTPWCWEGWQIL